MYDSSAWQVAKQPVSRCRIVRLPGGQDQVDEAAAHVSSFSGLFVLPRLRRKSPLMGTWLSLGDDHPYGHGPSDGLPLPSASARAASMAARNGSANCLSLAAPTPLTSANSVSVRGCRRAMSISVRSENTI